MLSIIICVKHFVHRHVYFFCQMTQRHSQLLEATINLKAPDDFKDYLLSSRNYLIRGKPSAALRQTNVS